MHLLNLVLSNNRYDLNSSEVFEGERVNLKSMAYKFILRLEPSVLISYFR